MGLAGRSAKKSADRWMMFELGGARYAIELLRIKEVLALRPITPIPEAPASISGLVNLRGATIPVVDLAKKLERTPSPRARPCLIFATDLHPDRPAVFAFAVDDVPKVCAVDLQSLKKNNDTPRLAKGVLSLEDTFTVVLNLEALLDEAGTDQIGLAGA